MTKNIKKTQLRGYKNDYNFLKAKQIKYLSQLSCFTNATKSQAPAKASRCNVSEKFVLGLKKKSGLDTEIYSSLRGWFDFLLEKYETISPKC